MLESWQGFVSYFLIGILCIITPLVPLLLYLTDYSFVELLNYIASNKFIILGAALIALFISNLNQEQILIFNTSISASALLGAIIGFLLMQAVK